MPEGVDLEAYVREHFQGENSKVQGRATRCLLEKIVIPNEGRVDCLKFLNKMNINRMSLFPDADGSAKYINAMWELDFDTALGHIADAIEEDKS